jgi:hypothetical protein
MTIYTVAAIASTPVLSTERGGRDIVVACNRRLWAAYSRKPAGLNNMQIHVACSDDDGQTWTEERVTFSYDNRHHFFPALAIDSFDNLHLVYTANGRVPFATRWGVFYKERSIGGWQAEETVAHLNVANPGQDYPTIAIGVADVPHVVWPGYGQGLSEGWMNYWYRKKAASWLDPMYVTNQDVNDQWTASLLWARYPEVGGVKTNFLPDRQKVVWEDMSVAILSSETPAYAEVAGIKGANMANRLIASRVI